jgi:hypothetical protein
MFLTPPVAQEPVQLLQCGVIVSTVASISDGDVLIRVDVMHRDCASVAIGGRGLQALAAEH